MPGRSGLEVMREIRNLRPNLPVLVLSIHPENQFAVRVLRLGAAGYMTKESAAEELVGAVKKVLGGSRYVSASLAETLAINLSSDTVKAAPGTALRPGISGTASHRLGQDRQRNRPGACLERQNHQHLPQPHPAKKWA